MAEQRGSKYRTDGVWWVKFPLPIGQTWSDPKKPGKLHTKIEVSVRTWYRAQGVTGKGAAGQKWAKRLLSELNEKFYSGEAITPMDRRTIVKSLMENLISTHSEKRVPSETAARQKLSLFERHKLSDTVAPQVSTDRLRTYRQQRIMLDGVSSATVNRDFALLKGVHTV